jgi:hypothetical protein
MTVNRAQANAGPISDFSYRRVYTRLREDLHGSLKQGTHFAESICAHRAGLAAVHLPLDRVCWNSVWHGKFASGTVFRLVSIWNTVPSVVSEYQNVIAAHSAWSD